LISSLPFFNFSFLFDPIKAYLRVARFFFDPSPHTYTDYLFLSQIVSPLPLFFFQCEFPEGFFFSVTQRVMVGWGWNCRGLLHVFSSSCETSKKRSLAFCFPRFFFLAERTLPRPRVFPSLFFGSFPSGFFFCPSSDKPLVTPPRFLPKTNFSPAKQWGFFAAEKTVPPAFLLFFRQIASRRRNSGLFFSVAKSFPHQLAPLARPVLSLPLLP